MSYATPVCRRRIEDRHVLGVGLSQLQLLGGSCCATCLAKSKLVSVQCKLLSVQTCAAHEQKVVLQRNEQLVLHYISWRAARA
mmetsp:Transcript_75618/g.211266  ORF Transcript_75618/g.211266 Transcript_75618/m.211266 type:complete len:83 (+) Transcript_75618:472-720(+)